MSNRDNPPPQSDDADLSPVLARLEQWQAPAPTAAETDRLAAHLRRQLPRHRLALRQAVGASLNLLRAQRYIIRQELLAASALVMGLGTLLAARIPSGTLANGTPAPAGLALALVAPLVAAVGVSFLYGGGMDPVMEMEEATPMSRRKILLARLTLIFGFNLLLGLAGSLLLAGAGWLGWTPRLDFFALVGIWLAPMSALSAAAFLLTVLSGDPLAGAGVSLLLWGLQALRLFGDGVDYFVRIPNLFALESRPALWALAAGLAGVAFWLAGGESRIVGGRA
jgi:hypothetical protein